MLCIDLGRSCLAVNYGLVSSTGVIQPILATVTVTPRLGQFQFTVPANLASSQILYADLISTCLADEPPSRLYVSLGMQPLVVQTPVSIDISAGFTRQLPVQWLTNVITSASTTVELESQPPLAVKRYTITSEYITSKQELSPPLVLTDELANSLPAGNYTVTVTLKPPQPATPVSVTSTPFILSSAPKITGPATWAVCLPGDSASMTRFGIPYSVSTQYHRFALTLGLNPALAKSSTAFVSFTVLINNRDSSTSGNRAYPTPGAAEVVRTVNGTALASMQFNVSLAPESTQAPSGFKLMAVSAMVDTLKRSSDRLSYYVQLAPISADSVQCRSSVWLLDWTDGMFTFDPVSYASAFQTDLSALLSYPLEMIRVSNASMNTVDKRISVPFSICEMSICNFSSIVARADRQYLGPVVVQDAVITTFRNRAAIPQTNLLHYTSASMSAPVFNNFTIYRCACALNADCSGGLYVPDLAQCPTMTSTPSAAVPAPVGECSGGSNGTGGSKKSSGGVIAGAVIGSLAGVSFLAVVAWYVWKRRAASLSTSGRPSSVNAPMMEFDGGIDRQPAYSLLG